jgi:hypothetical protein
MERQEIYIAASLSLPVYLKLPSPAWNLTNSNKADVTLSLDESTQTAKF